METPLLEIRDVKKYFPVKKVHGKEITVKAVDSINLKINQGEIVGLVGESGCGKSTLGKSILKLHEITGGQILFHGEDITNYNERQMRPLREKIQIIFQDPYASLNPRMSVFDIIAEPLLVHHLYQDKADLEKKVLDLLHRVGLDDYHANRYPHEFSGGQRQRINIARALAMDVKLLVCDEPVSALDVSVQAQVLNLLKQLKDSLGLTYIFISHDLSVVKYISDRIIIMYLGRVMEIGNAEEVYANPVHPYTKALFSAIPPVSPFEEKEAIELKGEIPSPLNMPSGCPFCNRCPYCKEECRKAVPELKKIGEDHQVACILA